MSDEITRTSSFGVPFGAPGGRALPNIIKFCGRISSLTPQAKSGSW